MEKTRQVHQTWLYRGLLKLHRSFLYTHVPKPMPTATKRAISMMVMAMAPASSPKVPVAARVGWNTANSSRITDKDPSLFILAPAKDVRYVVGEIYSQSITVAALAPFVLEVQGAKKGGGESTNRKYHRACAENIQGSASTWQKFKGHVRNLFFQKKSFAEWICKMRYIGYYL